MLQSESMVHRGLTFVKQEFFDETLPRGDIFNCKFIECNFQSVTDFSKFQASSCIFYRGMFKGMDIPTLDIKNSTFEQCDFSKAQIGDNTEVGFSRRNAGVSNLSLVDVEGSQFEDCSFVGAVLFSARSPMYMKGCDISGASTGAYVGVLPIAENSQLLISTSMTTSLLPCCLNVAGRIPGSIFVQNFDNPVILKHWVDKSRDYGMEKVPHPYQRIVGKQVIRHPFNGEVDFTEDEAGGIEVVSSSYVKRLRDRAIEIEAENLNGDFYSIPPEKNSRCSIM